MCTQELLLALHVGGAVLSPEAVILPRQCLSSPDLGHVPLGGPESPDIVLQKWSWVVTANLCALK